MTTCLIQTSWIQNLTLIFVENIIYDINWHVYGFWGVRTGLPYDGLFFELVCLDKRIQRNDPGLNHWWQRNQNTFPIGFWSCLNYLIINHTPRQLLLSQLVLQENIRYNKPCTHWSHSTVYQKKCAYKIW